MKRTKEVPSFLLYRISRSVFAFSSAFALSSSLFSTPAFSDKILSLDQKAFSILQKNHELNDGISLIDSIPQKNKQWFLISVPEQKLVNLSHLFHDKLHRCGGFMVEEDGGKSFKKFIQTYKPKQSNFKMQDLTQQQHVNALIEHVKEENLIATIKQLSTFPNRFYQSPSGLNSQKWLLNEWQQLARKNPNASVAFYKHASFQQPSIVFTLKGKTKPEEIVIVGGHADSIINWEDDPNMVAPGADDNASGIAVVTETIHQLMNDNYQGDRTLQFMAYAAEEVGLRGSEDIATAYKTNKSKVVGVLQLDMTDFIGTTNDMTLVSDFTDKSQNDFVGTLLKTYLPSIKFTLEPCEYACSDHASWTRNGFPASFPFEAGMKEYNSQIHTAHDTLDNLKNQADHSVPFAKLAIAYAVELSSIAQH